MKRLQSHMLALLWAIISLLYVPEADAQDFKADMQYLTEHVMANKSVNIKASIEIFDANDRPIQQQTYSLLKRDQEFKFTTNSMAMLYNKDVMLSINHVDKKIFISQRSAEKEQKQHIPEWDMGIDSLVHTPFPSVVYHHTSIGHTYVLTPSAETGIKEIVIVLSNNKRSIHSVEYFFKPDGVYEYSKIVIEYEKFDTRPIAAKEFSIANYVLQKKGKQVPASAYGDYEITLF